MDWLQVSNAFLRIDSWKQKNEIINLPITILQLIGDGGHGVSENKLHIAGKEKKCLGHLINLVN